MIKKGFTLAEILVTLSIIGIIAVIGLTNLMQHKPNKEQVMLKKAYYLAGRNINEMINDDDFYPDTDEDDTTGFANTVLAKYHNEDYSGPTKFCGLFTARMNLMSGSLNCNETRTIDQGGNVETIDGIVWSLPISDFSTQQTISFDVDGLRKGNNCFYEGDGACSEGLPPDRFRLKVDKYGKIEVPDALTKLYLEASDTTKQYEYYLRKIKGTNTNN